MKFLNLFLLVFGFSFANAAGIDRDPLSSFRDRTTVSQTPSGESIKWVGTISDESLAHNEHRHFLKFTRKSDGESFDLDSKSLMTLHHDREKNFLVEITAIRTPRFLFWGNNLIVKDFRILEELESVPHKELERPIRESPLSNRI